jgi:hypothetical protein
MTGSRHLTWLRLQHLIEGGAPFRHRIAGKPPVDVVSSAGGGSLSLLLPVPSSRQIPATKLRNVKVERRSINEETFLELSTSNIKLFEEFYYLAMAVADEVQIHGREPVEAVRAKLDDWEELLASVGLLSIEEQLGLWGELWMLRRLAAHNGARAIASWVGPQGETHDFRIGQVEYEVKTTRNRTRQHVISDARQLVPSPECSLYVLSLQTEPAGLNAGLSLADAVERTRKVLGQDSEAIKTFNGLLVDRLSYSDADTVHYEAKLQLRSKAILVPVDEKCPQLTPAQLERSVTPELLTRISRIQYTVDLDGLGFPEDSAGFQKLLPAAAE